MRQSAIPKQGASVKRRIAFWANLFVEWKIMIAKIMVATNKNKAISKNLVSRVFFFILLTSPLFLCQSLFAQNAQSQVVIPKQIFVGDTGELKIIFSSPIDFFEKNSTEQKENNFNETTSQKSRSVGQAENAPAKKGRAKIDVIELSAQNFVRSLDDTEYTIKKITLEKTGTSNRQIATQKTGGKQNVQKSEQNNYILSIIFTPWKTGELKIPPYNLGKIFESLSTTSRENNFDGKSAVGHENAIVSKDETGAEANSKSEANAFDFIITPSAIPIDSILAQKNIAPNFIPSKGPVLLPGTTYKIYFRALLLIVFLIALARLIMKWQSTKLFFKNIKLRLRYRKYRRLTLKALALIRVSEKSDREIAEAIQNIMRYYLQVRFDYPFTKSTTNELMKGFDDIFLGLFNEEKSAAVEALIRVFFRTDYIRYGKEGRFKDGERNTIVDLLTVIVDTFENKTKNDDEDVIVMIDELSKTDFDQTNDIENRFQSKDNIEKANDTSPEVTTEKTARPYEFLPSGGES